MKKLTIAIVAFGLAAFSAGAQDSDRATQMRRVVEGLNSADPVTRIITLEDAMGTGDRNIQRIALQTAFASSDLALRSAAMEGVMATKSALDIRIKTYSNEDRKAVLDNSSGRINMRISGFDSQTGNFKSYSDVSYLEDTPDRRGKRPITLDGNFSGDRLSFELNVGQLYRNDRDLNCSGVVTLGDSGSLLTGSMSCGDRYGAFGIEIDLLR